MANLEKGQETLPFIGMGGSSFSVTRSKSVTHDKSVEEPKVEKPKREEPKVEESKREEPKEIEFAKEGDVSPHPNDLPIGTTPEPQ
jgi:hypothetical protein